MSMTVKNVMGKVAIAVRMDATFADLIATMQRFKVGAVTVIDADRRPVGVVSEDDMLLKTTDQGRGEHLFEGRRRRAEHRKAAGAVAVDLMTRPPITVTEQTPVREAARLMHTNHFKQLPVIDPVTGRIVGTVHQGDLLKVFARPGIDIERDIAEAADRLHVDISAVTVMIDAGVVALAGTIPLRSQIAHLVHAVRTVDGVIDVDPARLDFTVDDLVTVPPLYRP
jgi:CBS domain-containing protein